MPKLASFPSASVAPVAIVPGLAPDDLLRKDELAARLKCSEKTVDRLVESGKIPMIRLGQRMHRFSWRATQVALELNRIN